MNNKKNTRTEEISERTKIINSYLSELYKLAKDKNYEISNDEYHDSLKDVFNSSTRSFREIVLVALVGKKLDKNFKASSGFYDCKPRGIYDNGPIKEFLLDKGFPHTKSGPLNIAKASKNIDEDWARNRSDVESATKVASLIKQIDNGTDKKRKAIGVDLMRMYIEKALYVESLSVDIKYSEDPVSLSEKCRKMIDGASDSGNTPQRIFGYLLDTYHKSFNTGLVVSGTEDSASATSTTSKKAGDINEESTDGTIYKVYEITLKKFDLARIKDSYACVKEYNKENNTQINEVIVVCRKEDCFSEMKKTELDFCMGYYEYRDIIYRYWNIYEWITYTLERMIPSARNDFYERLNCYINNINTEEEVKILWKELNSNE